MKRVLRYLIALTVVASTALVATPATAGTLTSPSWTTGGTGYATTNAVNTRYDYRFTTASSATLSRVTASVPAGITGVGARFLALNGLAGNYASTPSTTANNVAGDLDLRTRLTLPTWTPAAEQSFISKWDYASNQHSYLLSMAAGGALTFAFHWGANANNSVIADPGQTLPFAPGTTHWIRATLEANNGGTAFVRFYTSEDGSSWSPFGAVRTYGATSIRSSTTPVRLGTHDNNASPLRGREYFASVSAGINGTTTSPSSCTNTGVVACFNPDDYLSGTTFTSSSPQSETWTLAQVGAGIQRTDIARELVTNQILNLPANGDAQLRLLEGVASYSFTPASIPSGTVVSFGLTGFTNPAAAGGSTSTLQTWDNSGTPVVIDSATTGTFTFVDAAGSAVASVAVDPSFAFTLTGSPSTCNGLMNTNGANASGTSVPLGRINTGARGSGAQTLTLGTNSNAGFTVYLRSASATANVLAGQSNPSNKIADASAGALPSASTEAFGFTTGDTGVAMTSGNVAPVPTSAGSALVVSAAAGVQNRTSCVGYFASVASTTPADTYAVTVRYTAVPTF